MCIRDRLEIGQKLLCWGGQSLVSGILLEDGTYDLILQRQDGTDICPKDATTFEKINLECIFI